MENADYFAVCTPGPFVSAFGRGPDIDTAISGVRKKLKTYRQRGLLESVPLGCARTSEVEVYDVHGHKDVWLDLAGVRGDGGDAQPTLVDTRKIKVF